MAKKLDTTPIDNPKSIRYAARNCYYVRTANKLTKKRMSELVGVVPSTITRLENATRMRGAKNYSPHFKTVAKLAILFKVSVSDMTTTYLEDTLQ